MKIKITFALCLFSIVFSNAQYDWRLGEVVLRTNDTIKGFIKIPMVVRGKSTTNKKVKYRKNLYAKISKYDHTNAIKILFKDKKGKISFFEYIRTSPDKVQLLKIMYNSDKLRIYARKVAHQDVDYFPDGTPFSKSVEPDDYNQFYAQRKFEQNATLLIKHLGQEILNKYFRKNAMKYFSDCPELVLRLKNKTIRASSIITAAKIYNKCE
ncbi:hypothetical protein [Maribacter sp. Asnod1-A12]|uniref:hypothetical protein n=1 Tax=Maribacter sp. Asnod1-A12 TaxID=3160576 RepID=UPI003864F4B3